MICPKASSCKKPLCGHVFPHNKLDYFCERGLCGGEKVSCVPYVEYGPAARLEDLPEFITEDEMQL